MQIPEHRDDPTLEPAYAAVVAALRAHVPAARYRVILHGSTLWGDRSVLRSGLPISDIDLLVVGDDISDLPVAADQLSALWRPFARPDAPTFKLGIKFRSSAELASDAITANELAAVRHGRLLCGAPSLEISRPAPVWFAAQAALSVRTRIAYGADQLLRFAGHPRLAALRDYLAARILLEIPTALLLAHRQVERSYPERVRAVAALPAYRTLSVEFGLAGQLARALRTKRDPDSGGCGTMSDAIALLELVAQRVGVGSGRAGSLAALDRERPLDARDRRLLAEAVAR